MLWWYGVSCLPCIVDVIYCTQYVEFTIFTDILISSENVLLSSYVLYRTQYLSTISPQWTIEFLLELCKRKDKIKDR